MVEKTLVKDQIDCGWDFAIRFSREIAHVEYAFWARARESGNWFLYIVSSAVESRGWLGAYQAVSEISEKTPKPALLQFKIKLLAPGDRAVEDVRNCRDEFHHAEMLLYSPDHGLGDMPVDTFYIYPPINPPSQGKSLMTHDEVKKTIFDLLGRTGLMQPSTVTLQDGSSFQGVPFGVEISSNLLNVKFIDEASHLPRVVLVDQIASIQ